MIGSLNILRRFWDFCCSVYWMGCLKMQLMKHLFWVFHRNERFPWKRNFVVYERKKRFFLLFCSRIVKGFATGNKRVEMVFYTLQFHESSKGWLSPLFFRWSIVAAAAFTTEGLETKKQYESNGKKKRTPYLNWSCQLSATTKTKFTTLYTEIRGR